MPLLFFTVNPVAVGQLHDILACLLKFNEDVSLEATQSELRISSLNVSKTAYASFNLVSNTFFDKYHFSPDQKGISQPKIWTCRLQNRGLASVFRRRQADQKDKDTGIERCEFELRASANLPECRIIIRLICHFGVVKTYRLSYEDGEILHASFDKINSPNTWTVSSKTMADVVEYFGPKTEQLDWYLEDDKMTFTSYTEKVQHEREILKQPMHTSVALEKQDFDECIVEEGLHIGITVKDFRAIVSHALTVQANVNARYSRGNRPLQVSYTVGGLRAEFTLMTRGSSQMPTGSTTGTPARDLSVRPRSIPPQSTRASSSAAVTPANDSIATAPNSFKAPKQAESRDTIPRQTTPPATAATINPDSLFIPADDDDRQWDEPNFNDGDQDFVTWDASATLDPNVSVRRVRDSEHTSFASARETRPVQEIAPTQRLSQVKGLFD